MEQLIEINKGDLLQVLVGAGDKNINYIEKTFGVTVSVKADGIMIKGTRPKVGKASGYIRKMISLIEEGINPSPEDVFSEKQTRFVTQENSNTVFRIKVSSKKQYIFPRTLMQRKYVEAMRSHDMIFAVGPAGTGKTYLAMAMAVNNLIEGKVRRIVLTRPAIEAGESLGFLPGDIYAKLGPYLRPLYDALYEMMDAGVIEEYLETGVIEIAPLAFMRGRTLNSAFVILDEAQNCTADQIKMFLTRFGFNSRAVITGDITQTDLPGGKPRGLIDAVKLLKPVRGIQFVNLSDKDIVRHPLIQEIIKAYEKFYRAK